MSTKMKHFNKILELLGIQNVTCNLVKVILNQRSIISVTQKDGITLMVASGPITADVSMCNKIHQYCLLLYLSQHCSISIQTIYFIVYANAILIYSLMMATRAVPFAPHNYFKYFKFFLLYIFLVYIFVSPS